MTILYALLVLLVAVLVTTISSLYDLTIFIHNGQNVLCLLYDILGSLDQCLKAVDKVVK